MTLGEALAAARRQGLPRLDAERLLQWLCEVRRSTLFAYPERPLTAAQAERWPALLQRRLAGEPLAYLTGRQGFHDFELAVGPAVLIPRPETEHLVDTALELDLPASARVLELGTGSGAIAIALTRQRPGWQLLAVDASPEALATAAINVAELGPGRVQLLGSNWFSALAPQRFQLIVSNPPYVADHDPALADDVARHEPSQALFAGDDGLDALRLIAAAAPDWLAAAGWLVLEHGHDQGAAVRALLLQSGLVEVRTVPDYAGCERVTLGRQPG